MAPYYVFNKGVILYCNGGDDTSIVSFYFFYFWEDYNIIVGPHKLNIPYKQIGLV